MNEEALQYIYNTYGLSKVGTYDQFKGAVSTEEGAQYIHKTYLSDIGDYNQFKTALGAPPQAQSGVDPRVAAAHAASRAGKDYQIAVREEQQKATQQLEQWAKERVAQLSKQVKSEADVAKFQQLFDQELAAKQQEAKNTFSAAVTPKFEAWKAASANRPTQPEPSFWDNTPWFVSAPGKMVTDAVRTATSFATDTAPQIFSTLQLRDAPQELEDMFKPGYENRELPDDSIRPYILEFRKWQQGKEKDFKFDPAKHRDQLQQFFREVYDDSTYRTLKERLDPILIENRQKYERDIALQKKEAVQSTAGVVQNVDDVKSLTDFASLIGGLGAQAAIQMPAAVLTGGASSLLQEMATVYDQQVDNIAATNGLTREQVIEMNLDEPAAGQVYALGAAALDYFSVNRILKGLKSGTVQKALGVATETITEPIQGALEETGGSQAELAAKQKFTDSFTGDALSRRLTEGLGGLVGGGLMSTFSARQAADDLAQQIDPRLVQLQDQMVAEIQPNAQTIRSDAGQVPQTGVTPQTSQDQGSQDLQQPAQTPGDTQDQVKPRYTVRGELVEPDVYAGEAAEGGPGVGITLEERTKQLVNLDESEYTTKGRELIELGVSMGKINQEQARELQAKLNNSSGKNRNDRSVAKFTNALRDAMGLPVTITTTTTKQFVDGLKNFINGFKTGVKDSRQTLKELRGKVDELRQKADIPKAKLDAILNRVLGVNLGSSLQIKRIEEYLNKLGADLPVAEKYTEAAELRAKIKKNLKRIPQPQAKVIERIISINPNMVDNIDAYLQTARNAAAYLAKPTSTSYSPITGKQNEQNLGLLEEEVRQAKIAELQELGIEVDPGMGLVEATAILDGVATDLDVFAENADEAARIIRRDKLLTQLEYSKLGLPDDAYGRTVSKVNTDGLSNADIAKLIKSIDNYTTNGTKDTWVEQLSIAQQNMDKALSEKLDASKLELEKKPRLTGGTLFARLAYATGQFHKVAARIMNLSGMDAVTNAIEKAKGEAARTLKTLEDRIAKLNLNDKELLEFDVRQFVLGKLGAWYADAGTEDAQYLSGLNALEASFRLSEQLEPKNPTDKELKERNKVMFNFITENAAPTKAEFFAKVKEKYPEDYKIWELRKELLKPVNEKLKVSTEETHNKRYREMEDYAGKVRVRTLTEEDTPDLAVTNFRSDAPTRVAQSGTSIDRTTALAPNQIYRATGIKDFILGFEESLIDIYATPERIRVRHFFSDPRVVKIFGDNLAHIKKTFFRQEEALMGKAAREVGWGAKAKESTAWRFMNLTLRMAKTVMLSGPGRYLKQTIPVYLSMIWQLGGRADYMFKASKLLGKGGQNIKLFDNLSLGNRAAISGGLAIGDKEYRFSRTGLDEGAGLLDKLSNAFDKFNERNKMGQTLGDLQSAKIVWVANYLRFLEESGVDINTIDLTTEHQQEGREDAIAYANGITNKYAGPSALAEMPEFLRDRSMASQVLRNLFFFMGSFPALQKAVVGDAVMSFRTGTNKQQALTDLASVLTSTISYQAITLAYAYLLRQGGKWVLENIFDTPGEEPEKEEDSMVGDVFAKGVFDAVPFTVALGSTSEDLFRYALNQLLYLTSDTEESYQAWAKKGGGLPGGAPPRNPVDAFLDLAGPYLYTITAAKNVYDGWQAMGNGNIRIEGKDYPISPKQERTLYFLLLLDVLAVAGLDMSEVRAVKNAMRAQLKEAIKAPQSFAPGIQMPPLPPMPPSLPPNLPSL